jgi:hypothetical protein
MFFMLLPQKQLASIPYILYNETMDEVLQAKYYHFMLSAILMWIYDFLHYDLQFSSSQL